MARGSSARGRRTQRRAEARRQEKGVNEALVLTAAAADESIPTEIAEEFAELARMASEETFAIPADANYRDAEDADMSCGTCAFFDDGNCTKWDAAVESGYTCDAWEAAGATASGMRQEFRRALVATGLAEESLAPLTTYELTNGSLAERKFLSTAIESGFELARRGSWPCEAKLADHGEVLFRGEDEGVFMLDNNTLVYAQIGYGWARVIVAATDRDQAADTMDTFSSTYPPLYRDEQEDTVPITFWTNSKHGPYSRLRMLDSASWEAIEGNYSGEVREELERLMHSFEPGKDGQLILWQGSPGTGKTWALRALASEWKDWAEFNYITDPDSFFVSDPSYMIDVLLHESYETLSVEGDVVSDQAPEGKWRILILEDTGELLSANAKEAYGQGLSRLLNVVDGMVGQGLRILALVTTNDELGDLHPAAVRPGRCASQLEFGPLSIEESRDWLAKADPSAEYLDDVDEPKSLAQLYQYVGEAAEAFADAMDGTCADCNHQAMAHEGDMNDGACSIQNCDCNAFVEMDDQAASEGVTASVSVTPLFTADGDMLGTLLRPSGNPQSRMSITLGDVTFAPILPAELQPGEALPVSSGDGPTVVPPPSTDGALRWTAVLCPEGRPTDDGRIFAPGSITWRELPLTLMAMIETQEGHDGAIVCGRIDRIWRDEEAGVIRGEGEFDTGDYGSEIARLVADQVLRGISVDIAVSEMEIAYRSQILDEEGRWAEQEVEVGAEGEELLDALFGPEGEPVMFVVRQGVIGAATVCPFAAFADATIELGASLVASAQAPMVWTVTSQAGYTVVERSLTAAAAPEAEEATGDQDGPAEALTASAAGLAPEAPPAGWFDDPEFEELTGFTIDDDGRVYGHLAAWDTCHIGIPGVCTTAPHSHSDYAYFHLKEIVCDDGSRVACGTITLDTSHAGRAASRADAAAHYDDTGTQAVDVVVGEDEFGIWCAGALRADVDVDKARKLRGSVLSGDWRDVNGNLELVGLLAVNVPGFPVPRARALVASAGEDHEPRVVSLIAAGIHQDGHVHVTGKIGYTLTPEEDAEFELLGHLASGEYDALAAEAEAA